MSKTKQGKSKKNFVRKNPYEVITNKVIELLEKGIVPWKKPWKAGLDAAKNFVTKKAYRGINAIVLNSLAYNCPYFATFNQIKERGGKVKKGEKAYPIVYWTLLDLQEKDKEGNVVLDKEGNVKVKKIPLLRYFNVFNLEQQEGIEIPKEDKGEELKFNPIKKAEAIVKGYVGKPKVVSKEQMAFYRPSEDFINMPKKETFDSVEEYYSTLFHEAVHSTGHKKRLDREGVADCTYFGSESYSKEELVAEFGATFLCAEANIKCEDALENSAAYLRSWIKRLNEDKKLLVSASSKAQKAVKYILGEKEEKKKAKTK